MTKKDTVILYNDGWDDYSHKVRFKVTYVDSDGVSSKIGDIKILQRSDSENGDITLKTVLSRTFTELDERHISIGQNENYYRNLKAVLGDERSAEFLEALRDISWQPDLANPFEPSSAYRNALMRTNSAQRALRFGRAIVLGESPNERFDFSYRATIKGAAADTEIQFAFDSGDDVPGRIVALIGRNAVGKTRVLAALAQDLAQLDRSSGKRLRDRDERFTDGRPLFAKVLAVSYSAFDNFARPASQGTSYVYCGIRNDRGGLSRQHLDDVFKVNLARVEEASRKGEWSMYVADILGVDCENLEDMLWPDKVDDDVATQGLSKLSSGQAILTHFVTALLAWVQPNSLVLFDEPETHLHPNAVATLFGVLSRLLKRYDCYAILATHSPIVIQEVPAERVIVLRREKDVTSAEPLGFESFGESISELTRHVFETHDAETQYRRVLKRLAQDEDLPEVLERFPLGLSMSAQAFLIGQYAARLEGEQ
ncbi:ATP-dependent nuclease [Burkholderia cepacia]|uniref:ATP-dependent nuclease n=1 Tax=Burkholderia cepacia TaxID=292 RepID=UPI0009BF811C|nr:AAA family ATPase [Burkholderia cepacia]